MGRSGCRGRGGGGVRKGDQKQEERGSGVERRAEILKSSSLKA